MPRPYFAQTNKIKEIIQVDHAGEYGAQRIYQGQIAQAGSQHEKQVFGEMLSQEEKHLSFFTQKIQSGAARPTILMPVWKIGGYGLGAFSSFLGYKYAMIVTEAVEEVIIGHYQEQINYLEKFAPKSELLDKIRQFQQEEAEHIDIATNHHHEDNLASKGLALLTKLLCHGAIYLSKRV